MLVTAGRMDNIIQLLGAIGIFIFVLAITYFVTRWIGNYQKVQMKNRNMQVIETMRLTGNKYIQIVKVAKEYFVISVTKDRVELLTVLNKESVEALLIVDPSEQDSFEKLLNRLKEHKK